MSNAWKSGGEPSWSEIPLAIHVVLRSVLLFDFPNLRCTTSGWIGRVLGDRVIGHCVLTYDQEPDEWLLRGNSSFDLAGLAQVMAQIGCTGP